ncbi:hypothetical protein [Sphingomonas sp.]
MKRVLVLLVAGTALSGAAAVWAAANVQASEPGAKPGTAKPQGRIAR